MNALDVLRVLRRHPFVLALLLILTVAGAGLVYTSLPINYQSSASQILLPSKYAQTTATSSKARPVLVNPYRLTGDQPSQITASTLVVNANGGQFKRGLRADGVVSTPSVAISDAGGGVVIDVAATNKQAGVTSRDLKKILTALSVQLRQQQARLGGPTDQFYALAPVNPPDAPAQVTSGRFKTSVISGVLGVIVTLIIILIYDAQLRRRRPRGRRRTDGSGRARPAPDANGPNGVDGPERAPATSRAAGARSDENRAATDTVDRDRSRSKRAAGVTVPDRDAIGPRAR